MRDKLQQKGNFDMMAHINQQIPARVCPSGDFLVGWGIGAPFTAEGMKIYNPADLFLYSAMQASRRSWAVVSPGTL